MKIGQNSVDPGRKTRKAGIDRGLYRVGMQRHKESELAWSSYYSYVQEGPQGNVIRLSFMAFCARFAFAGLLLRSLNEVTLVWVYSTQ